LAYFLSRFILDKYNESRKFEKFTGGLPIISSNNGGNIAVWISLIVVGFGVLSFLFYIIFKNVKEKRSIDKVASNLYKELSKTLSY
jgi:hypothetical protein